MKNTINYKRGYGTTLLNARKGENRNYKASKLFLCFVTLFYLFEQSQMEHKLLLKLILIKLKPVSGKIKINFFKKSIDFVLFRIHQNTVLFI